MSSNITIVTTGSVVATPGGPAGSEVTGPISFVHNAGALVAGDILSRVSRLLGNEYVTADHDYARWKIAELLTYVTDACSEIVNLKPQANVVNIVLPLVAGTRQLLPDPVVMLRTVICNIAANQQAGSSPPLVPMEAFSTLLPLMHGDAPGEIVAACGYSPQDPKILYVYPPHPVSTGRSLLLSCVLAPLPLTTLTGVLDLGREYGPAVVDYVCYRCYQDDTDTGSAERSAKYLADFSAKVQAVPPR